MQANPTTAAAQDPLAELKDIHLPDPISWWPLAPGWWIAIALTLILLSVIIWYWRRHRALVKDKKSALKLLDAMPQQVQPEQLNNLLKRVALSYFDKHLIASLHGEQWLSFLLETLPEKKRQAFERNYQPVYLQSYAVSSDVEKEIIRPWLEYALPPKKRTLEALDV